MKIVGGEEEKSILILLGTAQDAGVPQLGCRCPNCKLAASESKYRRQVASIGLLNQATGRSYIIDATPDFKEQYQQFYEIRSRYSSRNRNGEPELNKHNLGLDGIFLTHIHMGHYIGLHQLGKEAYFASEIPVYATKSVSKFLSNNRPFSDLVRNSNITLKQITPNKPCLVESNLNITPIPITHRQEFSDTVGYLIAGMNSRVLYVPDMDNITKTILDLLPKVNIAILDGTFFDRDELSPHRKFESVPHPPINESIQILKPYIRRTRVFFTHFNHTNSVLAPRSETAQSVKSHGFGLAPERWTVQI